jgi:putative hydrolase of the HAD superfamily
MHDFPEFGGPMASWPQVKAVDHAESALITLHADYIICLATNAADSSREDIIKAFERINLSQYLDEIYCYQSIGFRKPSNEFFQHILDDLKIDKSRIVFVGDDFDEDIKGANDFGLRAIWLNRYSEEVIRNNMCKTIHSLDQLPDCLQNGF